MNAPEQAMTRPWSGSGRLAELDQWRARPRSVRPFRAALIVVVAVVTGGCGATRHHGSTSATTLRTPGAISTALEVTAKTLKSGDSFSAFVSVDNLTGHAIPAAECGSLFQVVLTNKSSHPTPTWLACAQTITIPMGVSTYPVTIEATYYGTGGQPLSAGIYRATTYELGDAVPVPAPLTLRVTR